MPFRRHLSATLPDRSDLSHSIDLSRIRVPDLNDHPLSDLRDRLARLDVEQIARHVLANDGHGRTLCELAPWKDRGALASCQELRHIRRLMSSMA